MCVVIVGQQDDRIARFKARNEGSPCEIVSGSVDKALARLSLGGVDAVVFLDGVNPSVTASRISRVRDAFPGVPVVALVEGDAQTPPLEILEAGAHELIAADDLEPAVLARSIAYAAARMRANHPRRSPAQTVASGGVRPERGAGVFETDLDYYIISWNEAARERFGVWHWDLKAGFNLLDFLVREDRKRILDHTIRVFDGERLGAVEYIAQNRSGGRFSVLVDLAPIFEAGRPTGVRITVLDPAPGPVADAERIRLQERLRQSQKLEALGLQSAGVAHDLNNVLNAVSLLASAAVRDLEPEATLAEDLQGIIRACKGGRDIIQRILRFAKADTAANERFSVNNQVAEVEFLLRFMTPKEINVELDLETKPTFVQGDPSEITHCLINVCINAVNAMNGSGTLTIQTRRLFRSELEDPNLDIPSSGACIAIRVTDTGKGMDKATLESVVKPFFTRQPPGQGTGLGLYMVDTTAKRHGGTVAIDSELGKGTTVAIHLPAATGTSMPMISAILKNSGRWAAS